MGTRASQQVVGAAGLFAPTSFARLRLIRQMHACGLLRRADETPDTTRELAAAARPGATPAAPDAC